MRVHLDAIGDTGLRVEYELDPADDEGLAAIEKSGEAVFLVPVTVTLDLQLLADTVEVRGHLATRLRLTCGRCLAEFEQDVKCELRCAYAPRPPERRHPTPKDLELNAEDVGLLFFDGQTIDTAEAVREEVMAAVPFRALCREDCRGLCPHCGTDLNIGRCQCAAAPVDPRLAVLATIRKP